VAIGSSGSSRGGQVREGLQALAEAPEVASARELRVGEAELYRLRGELLLQQAAKTGGLHSVVTGPSNIGQAGVESRFHQALDVARQQSAKTLELRAAMSLSRLWQQQGMHHEAHDLLAGLSNWFTEGFDSLDLREARLLLEAV
jgi:hypothetical protein